MNSTSPEWALASIAVSLGGWLLASIFATILAWTLWKYNSTSLTFAQAWGKYAEQAADLQGRHAKSAPARPVAFRPAPPELGQAVMQYEGADVEAMEQPEQPVIQQTAVIDELHEIERDLNRFRNDDLDFEKRDDWEAV